MNRFKAIQKIVEFGSFSKASDAIGCTQSAISQMVASVEAELGIKIFNRSRTGITLTHEGAELFPFIERAIYQYRAVKERALEIRGLETGTVRMGTPGSISAHWLPGLIKEFKEKHPGIEFVISQGDYISIAQWVESGAIDFGFVNTQAISTSELHSRFIKAGRMLAILPEEHPLAKHEVVLLKDLASEQFILLEEGGYSEPLVMFKSIGAEPNVNYTIHDDYAIMNMVEAGLGVSILAELMLRRIDYHLALRPTDPPIIRPISIIYKDSMSLSVAAKKFIELLRSRIDELP